MLAMVTQAMTASSAITGAARRTVPVMRSLSADRAVFASLKGWGAPNGPRSGGASRSPTRAGTFGAPITGERRAVGFLAARPGFVR